MKTAVALPSCALGFVLSVVASGPALSQNRGSSAGNELLLMDEQTVVTASKKVQKVRDVPAAVTVITEEQIRASGATTVLDLLRYAPGVDVSEQNGSVANVSVRGFNAQYSNTLLVMIDGRSVYQDFYGGIVWQLNPLLISRIKRIEIVRGPGSALYGANAFNGVINIITKTPAEMAAAPARTTVRTFEGEHNTQNLELQSTVGNPKDWTASLGLAYNHTDGFGSTRPTDVKDAYTAPILTLDIEKRLARGSLLLTAGNVEANFDEYQDIPLSGVHSHNSFVSLAYNQDQAANPIMVSISGNFLKQTAENSNYGNTKTLDVELQQAHRLGSRNSLVYGASYRSIDFISDVTGPQPHHEDLEALYLQDEMRFSARTSLFAGLRVDQNSIYGTQTTPRLSLVHHLSHRQLLRFSYGTAFHAPTLSDSFTNFELPVAPEITEKVLGDTSLSPTKVTSYEVGYRREFHNGFVGANGYYNRVSQLIGFVPTGLFPSPPAPPDTPSGIRYANIGGATAAGFEIESELGLSKHLHLLCNYAYEDVSGSASSLAGILNTRHKINLSLRGDLSPRWTGFLGAHFVGATSLDNAGQVVTIPAYTGVDARIAYRFASAHRPWTLALSATNLFDDHHLEYPITTAAGAPLEVARQRRTLYLSLSGSF